MEVYTDQKTVQRKTIEASNDLFQKLGKNDQSNITSLVSIGYTNIILVKYFLDNLFVVAMAVLIMLSILLIYSLMIQDINSKTYEYGMLRALGLQLHQLFIIIGTQAMLYSFPALIMGLLFTYLICILVLNYIFTYVLEISSYSIQSIPILIAFLVGIIMPLISNIIPIKRALSKTLKDSLDIYHRVQDQLQVQVIKLEQMGLSIGQSLIAFTLVIMGITCYYFAPMAFLYANIQLFLAILNIVLIFMILGFTLIMNLAQNTFENYLLTFLIYLLDKLNIFKDKALQFIIQKNMMAHKKRNNQTTLMFCIALAFIIFSGTGFELQNITIASTVQVTLGSDIQVTLQTQQGLPESKLINFLNQYMKFYPNDIFSYTFVSKQFNQFEGLNSAIYLSPSSGFPAYKVKIYGIEANYLDTILQSFYVPNNYQSNIDYRKLQSGQKDGFQGLFNNKIDNQLLNKLTYTDQNNIISNSKLNQLSNDLNYIKLNKAPIQTIKLVVPQGLTQAQSIQVDYITQLEINQIIFKGQISHTATEIPGFFFSSYRSIVSNLEILVSMQQLQYLRDFIYSQQNLTQQIYLNNQLFNNYQNNTYQICKQKMLIKLKRNLNYEEAQNLMNGIRSVINDASASVTYLSESIDEINNIFQLLNIFVAIIAFITMTISFFLLLVSCKANISESSWELGVYRALGLTKSQITRVYMYETLVIILTSSIIGSIVGIISALTITIQFLMFYELPFKFAFPYIIFFTIFFLSIITSLFSSYFALQQIKNQNISQIIKGFI